jgi:hypothetical protein
MLRVNILFRPLTSPTRGYLRLVALVTAMMVSLALTGATTASERQVLVIGTTKPLGPFPGTFSTSGAFSDSGSLFTEQRIVSALPSPFGVVSHLVLRFDGQSGTFTIRTEIAETVTDNPNIFANKGTWVIIDGTGAYSTLRGTGEVTGTVNDLTNLITRVFTGLVHFD